MDEQTNVRLVKTENVVFPSLKGNKLLASEYGKRMTIKKRIANQLKAFKYKKCVNCSLPCPLKIENLNKDRQHKCILSPSQVYLLTLSDENVKPLTDSIIGDITLLQGIAKTFKEKKDIIGLKIEIKDKFFSDKKSDIQKTGIDAYLNEVMLKVLRQQTREKEFIDAEVLDEDIISSSSESVTDVSAVPLNDSNASPIGDAINMPHSECEAKDDSNDINNSNDNNDKHGEEVKE